MKPSIFVVLLLLFSHYLFSNITIEYGDYYSIPPHADVMETNSQNAQDTNKFSEHWTARDSYYPFSSSTPDIRGEVFGEYGSFFPIHAPIDLLAGLNFGSNGSSKSSSKSATASMFKGYDPRFFLPVSYCHVSVREFSPSVNEIEQIAVPENIHATMRLPRILGILKAEDIIAAAEANNRVINKSLVHDVDLDDLLLSGLEFNFSSQFVLKDKILHVKIPLGDLLGHEALFTRINNRTMTSMTNNGLMEENATQIYWSWGEEHVSEIVSFNFPNPFCPNGYNPLYRAPDISRPISLHAYANVTFMNESRIVDLDNNSSLCIPAVDIDFSSSGESSDDEESINADMELDSEDIACWESALDEELLNPFPLPFTNEELNSAYALRSNSTNISEPVFVYVDIHMQVNYTYALFGIVCVPVPPIVLPVPILSPFDYIATPADYDKARLEFREPKLSMLEPITGELYCPVQRSHLSVSGSQKMGKVFYDIDDAYTAGYLYSDYYQKVKDSYGVWHVSDIPAYLLNKTLDDDERFGEFEENASMSGRVYEECRQNYSSGRFCQRVVSYTADNYSYERNYQFQALTKNISGEHFITWRFFDRFGNVYNITKNISGLHPTGIYLEAAYLSGGNVQIKARVNDLVGNAPVAGIPLHMQIGKQSTMASTDSQGLAYWTANSQDGFSFANASFAGNSKYASSHSRITLQSPYTPFELLFSKNSIPLFALIAIGMVYFIFRLTPASLPIVSKEKNRSNSNAEATAAADSAEATNSKKRAYEKKSQRANYPVRLRRRLDD